MTIDELLARLDTDIEADANKMGRWRQIHRIAATAIAVTLIMLPVLVAMKLLGEGIQPYCLFALTVLAAYDGLFRPAAYSARRRTDAADMTELLWQFRSAVLAVPPSDTARRLAIHDTFRKRFQDLYRQRGQSLVDYGLAQHESEAAKDKAGTTAPQAAQPTTTTATANAPTEQPASAATTAGASTAGRPTAPAGTIPPPAAAGAAAGTTSAATTPATNGDVTAPPS
jgi:hypothetical protein